MPIRAAKPVTTWRTNGAVANWRGVITSADVYSVGYVSEHRGGSPSPQLLIGTVESEFLGEPSINFLL